MFQICCRSAVAKVAVKGITSRCYQVLLKRLLHRSLHRVLPVVATIGAARVLRLGAAKGADSLQALQKVLQRVLPVDAAKGAASPQATDAAKGAASRCCKTTA